MSSTTTRVNQNNKRSLLASEKLNGRNFSIWYRNLRNVLRHEGKSYILQSPIPEKPHDTASRSTHVAYKKHLDDHLEVYCLVLESLSPEIRMNFERREVYDMIRSFKDMFQQHIEMEALKALHMCKMAPHESVDCHFVKMMSYVDELEWIDCSISKDLVFDLILKSLPNSYEWFILDYNLRDLDMDYKGLRRMLVRFEKKLSAQSTSKGKDKIQAKVINETNGTCYYCGRSRHLMHDCPTYLDELKLKKASMTKASKIEKK